MEIRKYEQVYLQAIKLAKQNASPRSRGLRRFLDGPTNIDRAALEPLKHYIEILSLEESLFLLTLVRVGRDRMPYDKLYPPLEKGFTSTEAIARNITETESLAQYLEKGWEETIRSSHIESCLNYFLAYISVLRESPECVIAADPLRGLLNFGVRPRLELPDVTLFEVEAG